MKLFDQFRSKLASDKETAWGEYVALLDRADNPRPDDADALVEVVDRLGLDPRLPPVHLLALGTEAQLAERAGNVPKIEAGVRRLEAARKKLIDTFRPVEKSSARNHENSTRKPKSFAQGSYPPRPHATNWTAFDGDSQDCWTRRPMGPSRTITVPFGVFPATPAT